MNVWKEPWLLDTQNHFIEMTTIVGLEEATVNSLIQLDGARWDDNILRVLFTARFSKCLLAKAKSLRMIDNGFFDAKGEFMVRNGYKQ